MTHNPLDLILFLSLTYLCLEKLLAWESVPEIKEEMKKEMTR